MRKEFENKVVIVTGACFGIGRATAIEFAKRGAKVAVVDCNEDQETMDIIEAEQGKAVFIKCDVSKETEVKAMVEKTIHVFGRIDYAFNNAGVEGVSSSTHECTSEVWDKTVSINLKGVWLCMKYQIIEMLKFGGGAIVNNSSIAGLVGFNGLPAYVASKHGVIGLTKTAAIEYARRGIRVNAICPGVIKTPMLDRSTGKNPDLEKQYENMEPIGRLGRPEEIAEAAIWLCSDAASFITGDAIAVDGGWVAQ